MSLSVWSVWEGGDSDGKAVRDVVAVALTPEQEAALEEILRPCLYTWLRDWKVAGQITGRWERTPNKHVEVRVERSLDSLALEAKEGR